jgi:hypothetical protein
VTLDCARTFASSAVTLVAGTGTVYTCSDTSSYKSIVNVTQSQSFTVEGGVVLCGNSTYDTTFYFALFNGKNAFFCLIGVELRYAG